MYIVNFTMRSKLVVVNDKTSIDVISVSNEFLVLKAEAEYFHTWFDGMSTTFSEVLNVFQCYLKNNFHIIPWPQRLQLE